MQQIRTYDYLAMARRRILDWTRPLGAEGYRREFPFGRQTLGRTLTHIMISEWYYIRRIAEEPVPPYEKWPIREEEPPPLAALETEWAAQAARTRATLGAARNWETEIEYGITTDDGRAEIVTASAGDIFTQLVLHEVHHRAQAMAMLRQMGVAAEDVDYNTTMYRRRPA